MIKLDVKSYEKSSAMRNAKSWALGSAYLVCAYSYQVSTGWKILEVGFSC